jgi:hypothetical protein
MAIPLQNFSIRFLATDFNTGTITVTLQISLHCSTQKVFKSHVKSWQTDFQFFFYYELPVAVSYRKLTRCQVQSSQSHIPTDDQSVSKSWCRAPSEAHDQIFITLLTVTVLFFVGHPHWREVGSVFYMCCWPLPAQVFLGSESLGIRDHILLSQIWDFPFRRLLRLAGSRWRYSTPPPHGFWLVESESESYVTTDGQSASLSWYKLPIRGLRPDFYFRTEYGIRLTVTFLIPWGALSDKRTGLSVVCAAGPCQRSLFRSYSLGTCDRILLSQISDFPFRRLLRLAGSRWRYSTPTPHGCWLVELIVFKITPLHEPHGNHRLILLRMRVYSSVAWQ